MFNSTIKLLEELKEKYKTKNPNIEHDISNEIFNLETFDIFDYSRTLNNEDIIELIIALIDRLENDETEKAKRLIAQDDGFYNSELKKCENNIDIYKKVYDLLCYKIY